MLVREFDGAPPPAMSLAVVGADYENQDKRRTNRRFEILLCKPGDPVELRAEPDNPADEHAVAVFSERGIQIGYISSQRAVLISKFMRDGLDARAVFQVQAPFGAYIRATFDGSDPVVDLDAQPIPARREYAEGVDPEVEFQPDPLWDD